MSTRRQFKEGKIALVLAGGGLTGVVYEIGVMRAIDDLLVDRTVNDFDIYVGTSAGSLVASGLANGLSSETLLQAIDGSHPEISSVASQDIFRFNTSEFLRQGITLPRTLLNVWAHYLRHTDDLNLFDLLWSAAEALPSGLYDSLALEQYVRKILTRRGSINSFDKLARELYIIATDLCTGERAVFGRTGHSDVPISLAVAASSAVPLLYKPVRIGDRDYVDGGLRGTASLDLAIERGATLIICVNPMVPFAGSDPSSSSTIDPVCNRVSDRGMQAIASQVSRITTHASLHYHVKQLRRLHPQVDIIVIEPSPNDYEMFFYNIMRYSTRLTVARHGFETITLNMAENYAYYKKILARHGIPLTRRLVIEEVAAIQQSGYDPEVIRSVLEAQRTGCNRRDRNTPVCQLTRALAELEMILDTTGPQAD